MFLTVKKKKKKKKKREVRQLVLGYESKLGHNFVLWKSSAIFYQDGTAEGKMRLFSIHHILLILHPPTNFFFLSKWILFFLKTKKALF